MKALVGLAALVIVLIGLSPLAKHPDATPRAEIMDLSEGQAGDIPPYIHSDPSDWR
ncbi:MAG TPA: hypothetical protein VKI44_22350 [Acetobacteraceae bacterium]|nr:hypothetical protein [Acetobacteraceae bacterium]